MTQPTTPQPCGCDGDQTCPQHYQAMPDPERARLRARGTRGTGRGRPTPAPAARFDTSGTSGRRVQVGGDFFRPTLPPGAVYIGRAAPGLPGSPWANPHRIAKPCTADRCAGAVHDRHSALAEYRADLPAIAPQARGELAGRDLACWCGPRDLCHGDLLLIVANGGEL